MPKAIKRVRRGKEKSPQYFIFEIAELKPTYILAIDNDRYRESAYRESAGLEFKGTCVFPKPLSGRSADFYIAGRRDCLTPEAFKNDETWSPRCIGELELSPDRGHFYTCVPHESLSFLSSLFIGGVARFVLLHGAPMSRGRSLCASMQLVNAVDLEYY